MDAIVAAATTYENAIAAVEGWLARQPYTSDADRDYIPFHASVLVLANRRRLSNSELSSYLRERSDLLPLVNNALESEDEEERKAARRLHNFFDQHDDNARMVQVFAIARASNLVAQQNLFGP
jgi:hypothetical protein